MDCVLDSLRTYLVCAKAIDKRTFFQCSSFEYVMTVTLDDIYRAHKVRARNFDMVVLTFDYCALNFVAPTCFRGSIFCPQCHKMCLKCNFSGGRAVFENKEPMLAGTLNTGGE